MSRAIKELEMNQTSAAWQTKKLGEVCEVFADGDWIEKKDQSTNGIRLIQTGNIGNGYFLDRGEKARYISEATFKRLRCTEILPGDCLLSRLPDPVGRTALIPDVGQKMITAVDCTIMRFKKDVLPKWFIYYSLSPEYQNEINKAVTGATRQRISRSNLGNVNISVPPIPEQKRLVKIFDEIFENTTKAQENAEKNFRNAKEILESYLQTVFATKGAAWRNKNLGEIATFRNGMNFTKGSKGELIKIVGVKDFQKNFWVPLEDLEFVTIDGKLGEMDFLKKDDILTVRSNGNPELIGRCILAGKITEKTSHSGFTIRIRLTSSEYSPQYLCHYLKSKEAKRLLIESGTGVNIKSLNQVTLSSLVIPTPSLKDQRTIANKIDALSTETKKLEEIYQQKLADLEELKKSILQKAFNGELTGARG